MVDKKSAEDLLKIYKNLDDLIQKDINSTSALFNSTKKRALELEKIENNQRIINELKARDVVLSAEEINQLDKLEAETRKLVENARKHNEHLRIRKNLQDILNNQLKLGWKYLQDQDKIIKSTILNLGMSGDKAMMMRDAFNQSAGYVTMLGGNLEDIQTIMSGYADETGRARVMSASMVEDITSIGKGTGLGIEQATKLGAQFELMGFNAKGTMDYVQGVVDTSERMGVNTTKVLKNVNDNFRKLNTYTFQQGVKGFGEMAMYAEKFKMNITDVLGAADIGRNLEGAVNLAAQLQVMGGEFAKTDPFEILFLSRNDPAKLTEKIADMTKGIVSFRKMADGSFEKFISPADRDRLASVAKSLGMEVGALTEIAQRQAEIQKMRQQTAGMGLTKQQQELIEGAAIFDQQSGKFQVQIGQTLKNIGELTATQASSFEDEQVLLKERAKQALTFDETFKATLNAIKSTLLPLLSTINSGLESVKPILEGLINFSKTIGPWATGAGLIAAAMVWKGVGGLLTRVTSNLAAQGGGRAILGNALGGKSPVRSVGSGRISKNAGSLAKGQGMKSLGAGAGIGAAMAGTGAGIMLAAKGIGELADKMAKLDKTQIWALPVTVLALSAGFWAMTPSIIAVGTASSVGALGLLALGASVVGIGFGINLAAKGIGVMSEGLGTMFEKSKGAGKDMLMVAGGIAGVAGSLALFSNPLSSLGLVAFAGVMGVVIGAAVATAKVASNLEKMGVAMKGSKDDWIAVQNAVESISKGNINSGGIFNDLANLLKKPLEVKFSKDTMQLRNDITLEIDGKKFFNKNYNNPIAVQKAEGDRTGKYV